MEKGLVPQIGETYLVTYKLKGQKKPRVMRGKYLGWSKYFLRLSFDLRPEHGTTELRPEEIEDIKLDNGPSFAPRLVR